MSGPTGDLKVVCRCGRVLAYVRRAQDIIFLQYHNRLQTLEQAHGLAVESGLRWRGADRNALAGHVEMAVIDKPGATTIEMTQRYFGAVAIDLSEVKAVAFACTCRLDEGHAALEDTLRASSSAELQEAWKFRHARKGVIDVDQLTRYTAIELIQHHMFPDDPPEESKPWNESVAVRRRLKTAREVRRDLKQMSPDERRAKTQRFLDKRNLLIYEERDGGSTPELTNEILRLDRLIAIYSTKRKQ